MIRNLIWRIWGLRRALEFYRTMIRSFVQSPMPKGAHFLPLGMLEASGVLPVLKISAFTGAAQDRKELFAQKLRELVGKEYTNDPKKVFVHAYPEFVVIVIVHPNCKAPGKPIASYFETDQESPGTVPDFLPTF